MNPESYYDDFSHPKHRLSNFYYIVDKNGKRTKLAHNQIQKRINDSISQRKMILKARQFGVSTNELIKMLDFVMWKPDVTAVILAHEKDAIAKLFRIVRRAYDFMDPNIRPDIDRGGGSKYEMYFPDHNSRIYCDLESRGDTINWLHISEAAFFKDIDKMGSTIESVPIKKGIVTLETTPNGMANHFYDMWNGQDGIYERMFFPWFIHSDYQIPTGPIILNDEEREFVIKAKRMFKVDITDAQIAFRRLKKNDPINKHLFIQEYPEDDQSCFLASGSAAMDLMKVKEQLDQAPNPIEVHGAIKIYKTRNSNHRYVIGADTSEGVGGDASAASVIDIYTREQVATIHGQFKPYDFAYELVRLAEFYAKGDIWPELAVERNNHGHAVLLQLNEHCRYPHLYVHTDDRIGWVTDRVTRPIMLDAFIDGVENQTTKLLDTGTLKECLTLVCEDGKIEAGTGKTDDRIMAFAVALQLCIKSTVSSLYDNIGSMIRI